MGGSHVEAVRQTVSIADVRPGPGNKFGEIIAAHLKDIGMTNKRIGLMNAMSERFGEEYMPANHYLALKEALPEAELVFVAKFFHELMYLHSEEEIRFIIVSLRQNGLKSRMSFLLNTINIDYIRRNKDIEKQRGHITFY